MLNQRTTFTSTHSFGRMARQVAVCGAVAALTACGGGGDGGDGGNMFITREAPDTLAEALAADPIPLDTGTIDAGPVQTIRESIHTRDDEDFYRFAFRDPAEFVVSTTGIETNLSAFDRDNNPLPTRSGSIIVDVTDDLIRNKGGEVIVRVTASRDTGNYELSASVRTPTPPTATSTPKSI